jgi:uncharacterized protein YbjT (DUF2867 family)
VRVFLAGATGVIGSRLVPMLVAAGHEVAGTTRTPDKATTLEEMGATPVVVDVFDSEALRRAVVGFGPEMVIHQLTDLPDDATRLSGHLAANSRMRIEGAANLVAAARAAGATRLVAQSIAWEPAPGPTADGVASLERQMLDFGGTILRYGQFYGPGTFHPHKAPVAPRVHLDTAAWLTMDALHLEPGVYAVTDDGIAAL